MQIQEQTSRIKQQEVRSTVRYDEHIFAYIFNNMKKGNSK